jgi:hypothetical protein
MSDDITNEQYLDLMQFLDEVLEQYDTDFGDDTVRERDQVGNYNRGYDASSELMQVPIIWEEEEEQGAVAPMPPPRQQATFLDIILERPPRPRPTLPHVPATRLHQGGLATQAAEEQTIRREELGAELLAS